VHSITGEFFECDCATANSEAAASNGNPYSDTPPPPVARPKSRTLLSPDMLGRNPVDGACLTG
jgi:hypothetical protein